MDEQPEKIPKKATRKQLRRWLASTRAMLAEARRQHEHPPAPELGTLTIAGMAAKIVSVEFREGLMYVTARLPKDATGPLGGRWAITGPDGTVCYRSYSASPDGFFGTKTGFAVWELCFAARLEPPAGWPDDDQAAQNFPRHVGAW